MKIAAFHNLPPGGALRVASEQFKRLGDQIAAAYVPDGNSHEGLSDSTQVHPITLRRCKQFNRPFGRLNGLMNALDMLSTHRLGRKIAADIDLGGYDVVLAHPCAVIQAPWVLEYLRTPSVYYCHEPFRGMHEILIKGGLFYPPADPLRAWFSRMAISVENTALHNASTVLCNSRYTHEYLMRSYGINACVNYPGVNSDVFHPTGSPKKNIVMSVGRLSFLKGHEFVIDSLALLPFENRPVLNIVCGPSNSDAEISKIKRYAVDCGVNIELRIDISDAALVELYNSSIATLAAPILEPLGLVPLESMACGTPVVGIAEGGIRESVIDQVTGYLTNRDPVEFSQALSYLIANPDKVEEMGRAGVDHVQKNWTWEKSIDMLRSVLDKTSRVKT